MFRNAQVVLDKDKITELVSCSHDALRAGNDEASCAVVPLCMISGKGLKFRDLGQVSFYRKPFLHATEKVSSVQQISLNYLKVC